MPKKKILIIIPSMGVGGAENVLLNFLNLMDYERYEVDLCVVLKRGKYLNDINPNVRVFYIYTNRYLEKLSRVFYKNLYSKLFYKFFGKKIKGKYNFGICFLDSGATEFLIHNDADIKRKATLVQSSYKSWDLISKNMTEKYRQQMISRYKKIDTIISVAEDSKKEFDQLFGYFDDHKVIYSPIYTKKVIKLANEEAAIQFDPKLINFIAVGRLIEVKGYDILIKAAQLLKKKNSRFHIYIAGMGPLEKKLKEMVLSLDLSTHVSILGFVDNVYPLVKQADVYIMPSRSEGLPTALCEAMILGKPVIANNVPGCAEAVQRGKYGLMPDPVPESICEAMLNMIENEALRLKYATLAEERSKVYNDDFVMNKYYALFDA